MIIALSGPSGIGKGFIKERLLALYPDMEELRWLTTRSLRPGEEGGNRIHVPDAQFTELVRCGEIVLVQSHFNHHYGLRKGDLAPCALTRLTELHPSILRDALGINSEIILIGLVTPDLSLLRKRLAQVRKTESLAEIEKRIAQAESEMNAILEQRQIFAAVIEVTEAKESFLLSEIRSILDNL